MFSTDVDVGLLVTLRLSEHTEVETDTRTDGLYKLSCSIPNRRAAASLSRAAFSSLGLSRHVKYHRSPHPHTIDVHGELQQPWVLTPCIVSK